MHIPSWLSTNSFPVRRQMRIRPVELMLAVSVFAVAVFGISSAIHILAADPASIGDALDRWASAVSG